MMMLLMQRMVKMAMAKMRKRINKTATDFFLHMTPPPSM